jgi:hypothetical protein
MKAKFRLASTKRLLRLARLGQDYRDWYPQAIREIKIVCELENWSIPTFVDILAITSPRVAVRRNVRITLQYMQSGILFQNTMSNIKAALEHWQLEQQLRGPKIEAFRRALLGDTSSIVLDVHMANAFRIPQKLLFRKDVYKLATSRVQQVAKKFRTSPRDAQAMLWAGSYRELNGTQAPYFPILSEYNLWQSLGKQYPETGSIDLHARLTRRARYDARQRRLFELN